LQKKEEKTKDRTFGEGVRFIWLVGWEILKII